MRYIRDHWQGKHALFYALLVNLILLRAIILFADRYTLPPFIPERVEGLVATITFAFLFHGIVFVWQVVGVLRATRHLSSILANIWTCVAYVAIALCLTFTFMSIAASFRALTPERFIPVNPTALEDARAAQYSLSLNADETRVLLTGTFTHGMTQKLSALLDQHPEVTGIVLSSEGGHIYEGRGVAYLIRNRNLDTYVLDICKSACTTAFIGGAKRYLGAKAQLGFHQYKLELDKPTPLYDLQGEQEKEVRFYREQGISEAFLRQVFLTPASGIWFPSEEELLEAGVVDEVIE